MVICTLGVYGQAPKKAKAIMVVSDSISKDMVAEALIENGWDIASTNEYTIRSNKRKFRSWDFDISISKVKDGYRLTCYWYSKVSVNVGYGVNYGGDSGQVMNKGTKGGANMVGWIQLEKVADSLGGNLEYE